MTQPQQDWIKSGFKLLALACLALLWGRFFSSTKPLVSYANYGIAVVALVVGIYEIVKGLNCKRGGG